MPQVAYAALVESLPLFSCAAAASYLQLSRRYDRKCEPDACRGTLRSSYGARARYRPRQHQPPRRGSKLGQKLLPGHLLPQTFHARLVKYQGLARAPRPRVTLKGVLFQQQMLRYPPSVAAIA